MFYTDRFINVGAETPRIEIHRFESLSDGFNMDSEYSNPQLKDAAECRRAVDDEKICWVREGEKL